MSLNVLEMNQPLNYRNIVAVAKTFGWQEDPRQGKGSHRCLVRQGYPPIVLTCHGESNEFQRGVTRKYLNLILQPLKDAAYPEAEALPAQLEQQLTQLEVQFQQEYQQCLDEASARIAMEETKKLEESEQTIAALVAEKTGIKIQEIELLQQDLADSQAKYQQKQQAVESLQQQVGHWKAEYQTEAQQSRLLNTQIHRVQANNTQLRTSRDRYRWAMWLSLGLSACLGLNTLKPLVVGNDPLVSNRTDSSAVWPR